MNVGVLCADVYFRQIFHFNKTQRIQNRINYLFSSIVGSRILISQIIIIELSNLPLNLSVLLLIFSVCYQVLQALIPVQSSKKLILTIFVSFLSAFMEGESSEVFIPSFFCWHQCEIIGFADGFLVVWEIKRGGKDLGCEQLLL